MTRKHMAVFAIAAIAVLAGASASLVGLGPSFHPDARFTGSNLSGWHVLGDAAWHADNGELIGTPRQATGGWLVLDRSLQDVGFYATFRCTGGCQTGILLRAEKTPDGMKGVYVSLTDRERTVERVHLDRQGRITNREALRSGGGQTRIAPPVDPNAKPPAPSPASGRVQPPSVPPPLQPPDASMRAGDWNQIEILVDANIVRTILNNGSQAGAIADEDAGRYGPVALYVGGSGEVRFKDVAYKDLSIQVRQPEEVSSRFRKQQVSDFYYAWGAGAADFDHDGVIDLVAGPHIFFGPDFVRRREIYLQLTSNPSDSYTTDCWMQFVDDFTGDGWADVITPSFSSGGGVTLYVNPKGESRRWDQYRVLEGYNTEIGVLQDIDGDGKNELVYGAEGQMRYAKPDPANPTGAWIVRNVSEPGYVIAHGVGAGDINGDGRVDIVNPNGWWEQPPAESRQELWTYHPHAFGHYNRGVGGSVMAVYDVNGDGLNDVVTVLAAHGWGLAWFEQKRDARGGIRFDRHMIMDDLWADNAGGVAFSQPHGSNFGDVDGDGITDFIVGKRYWAHRDTYLDPDPYGQAVLYWYRTVRNPNAPGGAEFVPELIHNRSGTGSDVLPFDLNKDGRLDVVTATRFGTFIFWGKPAP